MLKLWTVLALALVRVDGFPADQHVLPSADIGPKGIEYVREEYMARSRVSVIINSLTVYAD